MKDKMIKSVAALVTVVSVWALLALSALQAEGQQARPSLVTTNLPWTWVTNAQTFTFPLTNGPTVSVANGISYGGLANSNWFGSVNTAFTNGWNQIFMNRGMAVWVGISPTNSTATNTVVTGWTVGNGNGSAGDVYANNTILVTNQVNSAGTNMTVSYLGPLTIDNVGFAKLVSLQLIQTNSSVALSVWTSIIP